MILTAKKQLPTRDIPITTRGELESEWRKAKECFDQALARKTETDLLYVAAATQLNTIERLVKKMEHQATLAKREANRSIQRTA